MHGFIILLLSLVGSDDEEEDEKGSETKYLFSKQAQIIQYEEGNVSCNKTQTIPDNEELKKESIYSQDYKLNVK